MLDGKQGRNRDMDEVRKLIARFEAAVALYDRALACADCRQRTQLLAHRSWDMAIIADLRQIIANA
jgi:hypothetical protein